MAGNTVRIGTQVTGVAKSSSELDKFRDKFEKLQKQGAKGFGIGVGAAITASALTAMGNAARGAGDFLVDSTKAAIDEEAQIGRLSAALKANAKDWDGNIDAIERRIDANKKMAFSDDEQRDALTKLIPVTQNVNDAFNAQAVAMDLARLKNISLEEAASLLAKAFNGQMRGLKELGINVKDVTSKSEILAAVQEKAAGQADAYAESHAGAAKKIGDAWSDFTENVGGEVLKSVDNLSAGFDYLDWRARKAAESGDNLAFITDMVGDNADKAGRGIEDYAVALNKAAAANASAKAEMAAFTGYLTSRTTPAVIKATDKTDDFKTSLDDVKKSWDTLNDRLKAHNEFEDLPDKITVAAGEVKTALAELNEAIESGDKVAIAAARLRLRQSKRDLQDLRDAWATLKAEMSKPVTVGRVYHPGGGGGTRNIDLPGASSGMPTVPADMPVFVHRKEAILTPPQADAWRAGAGGGGGAANIYVTANLSPTGYSPAQAEQVAQAIGPAIATYLRRRGLLAAG